MSFTFLFQIRFAKRNRESEIKQVSFDSLTSVRVGTLERDFQREVPDCQISWIVAALAHLRQTFLDTLNAIARVRR